MRVIVCAISLVALASSCGSPKEKRESKNINLVVPDSRSQADQPHSQPSKAPAKSTAVIGEWAELDRECAVGPLGDGNKDGVGDDLANMEIRADSYGGYDTSCDLNPHVQFTSAYHGKAVCYSEGSESPPMRISFELMPDGKMKMTSSAGVTFMKRCK